MKKIILMLLVFSTVIFASDDALLFYVDTPDMVDMYFLIFSAIARVFHSGDYVSLLRLVFLVGGVLVFAGGIFKSFGGGGQSVDGGAIGGYLKYLVVGVALLTLVFWNGHTPILIKAKYMTNTCDISGGSGGATTETSGVAVPDGVPTLVAYGYYFTNQIGTVLTDLAVESYSTVYDDPYQGMNQNNGYMGALKGAMRVMAIDPSKVTLKQSKDSNGTAIPPYDTGRANKALFTDCILVPFSAKGAEGEKQLNLLKSSPNLVQYLEDTFGGSGIDVGGTNSRDFSLNYAGNIMNCGKFYDDFIKPINDQYGAQLSCGMPVGLGAVSLLTGAKTDSEVSSSFDQVAMQAGLVSQLEDSSAKLGVGVSGVAYASGKTRGEFIQSSLASGQYMSEMLPFLQMTIRAILYAFFPFVFVIVLLPGGIKVLGNYVQSLIWVELWSPTAAILDLFMTAHAKSQIQDIYKGEGLTMMSSIDMLSAGSTIAGVAGYLYMSVPALTWLILKGSAQMLQGIGSAAAAGMARNITTDSINRDQTKFAKQREASLRAGKDISMAEMQHYEAVQSGRMEGAALGVQMKAGMDNIADMEASNTQMKISDYKRVKDVTGVGGAAQGDLKGKGAAQNNIDNVEKGKKLTMDDQKAQANKNSNKAKGEALEANRNARNHNSKNYSLAQEVETAKLLSDRQLIEEYGLDGVALNNTLNNNKNAEQIRALTNRSPELAKKIGRVMGNNQNFQALSTDQKIKTLAKAGLGYKEDGTIAGLSTIKNGAIQSSDLDRFKAAGYKQRKGESTEQFFQRVSRDQARMGTPVSVQNEDGSVTKMTIGQDGTVVTSVTQTKGASHRENHYRVMAAQGYANMVNKEKYEKIGNELAEKQEAIRKDESLSKPQREEKLAAAGEEAAEKALALEKTTRDKFQNEVLSGGKEIKDYLRIATPQNMTALVLAAKAEDKITGGHSYDDLKDVAQSVGKTITEIANSNGEPPTISIKDETSKTEKMSGIKVTEKQGDSKTPDTIKQDFDFIYKKK